MNTLVVGSIASLLAGLAVGVGFGNGNIADGILLAVGIGLQNMPEGFMGNFTERRA